MAKETVQMNKNTVIEYLKYSRGIDDEIKIKRNIVEDLEMCYDTSAARLRAKRDKRVQRRYRAVAEVKVRDCKRSTAVITETKAGNNDVLFPESAVGTDRRPSALFRTAVQEHTG